MRKANVAIALLIMAIGIVVVVDAVRLGFGWSDNGPRAGFFPFLLGVGLVVCSAIVLRNVYAEHRKKQPAKRLMPPGAWKPITWVVAPSAGMILLVELIGLHLAAAVFLVFYMRVVGKVRWATTLAIAILVPAVLFVSFEKVFLVPMPQGLWGAKLLPF
jgi:hypothetical protein